MSEPFDFDFWVQAYKDDPEGYDELAKAYIHRMIDEMDCDDERKQKLKGLYWKCTNDPKIRNLKNPFMRAQAANTMMMEHVMKLDRLWRGITDEI